MHNPPLPLSDLSHSSNPLTSLKAYEETYQRSLNDPQAFWLEQAEILDWIKKPTIADESDFSDPSGPVVQWFSDGQLNTCFNCVDRHALRTPDKTAIIFEADEPAHVQKLTYLELFEKVRRFAGVLKSLGVKEQDVVTLYLPMTPDLIIAMLACARIGAIHSVVFSGFSSDALASRLNQAESTLLITTPQSTRGGKVIELYKNVKEALQQAPCVKQVLWADALCLNVSGPQKEKEGKTSIIGSDQAASSFQEFTLKPLEELVEPADCVARKATDPLFLLYTSGSTGKPKGVIHSTGGYSVYAALTHKLIFDAHNADFAEKDVYFCTADIGWITGHSYGVYGPLANGSTLVLFQGVPTYPDASRFWEIIDQHKVTQFYTAPTALRSLIRMGDAFVEKYSLESLRVLGSVGEPIDPPTWQWFFHKIGKGHCPVMDTWWQTESGGVLICPLLSTQQKPGCAAKPFFGVRPVIRQEKSSDNKGSLCIKKSWPGQTMGIWKDSPYFAQAYFSTYPGLYTSGDGAMCDNDGDFWILGRMDDVLNVSGHRLNSAELEQAAVKHPALLEACVVGFPHEIKGQGICIFAVLRQNVVGDEALIKEIKATLRQTIGPIATPDKVVLVHDLPKTRSGKIVRRLLRKMASQEYDQLGDTSTLINPACLQEIKVQVKKA